MVAQTNMQALEDMFNTLNQKRGGGGTGTAWFKPSPPKDDGSGVPKRVRILPQGENNNFVFFSHMVKHFNVSEKPFTCPKTHKDECQVCELSWKFWKESKRTDIAKEVKEHLAKTWSLSKNRDQHHLVLLDREDKGDKTEDGYEFPDGKPKVWGFSNAVRKQLGQIMCPEATDGDDDTEFFDITGLAEGIDINVSKEINKDNGIPMIKVYVPLKRKSTEAFASIEDEEDIPDYPKVDEFVTATYEPALEEALAFLNREWAKYAGDDEYDGAVKLNEQGTATSKKDTKADLAEAKKFVSELVATTNTAEDDDEDDDEDLPFQKKS